VSNEHEVRNKKDVIDRKESLKEKEKKWKWWSRVEIKKNKCREDRNDSEKHLRFIFGFFF